MYYSDSIDDFTLSYSKDPEYVAVHENSRTSTPKGLTQVIMKINNYFDTVPFLSSIWLLHLYSL